MKCLRPERAEGFAAELVRNGFNPVEAVVTLGITSNRNSAHVIGWRLLRNVTTQLAIRNHMREAKMSADEVLERLTEVARTDAEFKGSDVLKAAELLGKGHGLFRDVVETTNTTERDSFALTLYAHVTDAVMFKVGREQWANLTDEQRASLEAEGAIALHATMARTNHPTLAATSAWGKWQATIEANLAAQAAVAEPVITEIGDQ